LRCEKMGLSAMDCRRLSSRLVLMYRRCMPAYTKTSGIIPSSTTGVTSMITARAPTTVTARGEMQNGHVCAVPCYVASLHCQVTSRMQ